jgi:hypothetical protein
MATAATLPPSQNGNAFKHFDNNNAPKDIFPDGIKTSGQHEPVPDLLRPYEAFPEKIQGPTVWTREDYKDQPEKWTHRFTKEETEELGKASDDFIAAGIPLTGISQVSLFALPCRTAIDTDRKTSSSQFCRNA